jgi:hypothetical protein
LSVENAALVNLAEVAGLAERDELQVGVIRVVDNDEVRRVDVLPKKWEVCENAYRTLRRNRRAKERFQQRRRKTGNRTTRWGESDLWKRFAVTSESGARSVIGQNTKYVRPDFGEPHGIAAQFGDSES